MIERCQFPRAAKAFAATRSILVGAGNDSPAGLANTSSPHRANTCDGALDRAVARP